MLNSGIRITVAEESQNEYDKEWDKNEDRNTPRRQKEKKRTFRPLGFFRLKDRTIRVVD